MRKKFRLKLRYSVSPSGYVSPLCLSVVLRRNPQPSSRAERFQFDKFIPYRFFRFRVLNSAGSITMYAGSVTLTRYSRKMARNMVRRAAH